MNRVFLIGRLTKDVELRTIASGSTVANFSIAVQRPFTSQNGERGVDFFNCVIWNKPAENLAKYCSKGSQIAVEGRVENRSYDAQDGSKRYITEIQASNVEFLGTKGSNDSEYVQTNNNSGYTPDIATTDVTEDPFKDFGNSVELSDDDLPF